ncbi:hypothetical protein CPK_ORF00683 [Chlamydia pneumoniae LPCoLN]|uniref:hypothetical protein n=1 Tax=Chlamydia pneumoniae TaxID=83558 RepID=UPI0001BD9D3D|nr:hypothetical protein [Chlamydia pneumoniae]ACZ33152.1 hypothetical protein CPK_ORF00683 [Chlamydia pneumoniae LPCoLN]ETR80043.1 hypothetical protein X556_0620 [Chlamydia pneumoniae B21]
MRGIDVHAAQASVRKSIPEKIFESKLIKITSLIIALLALVSGIALTALAGVGVLSVLPCLILGIVLIVLSFCFLLFCCKFPTLKEIPVKEMPVSKKNFDPEINRYFQEQRHKDLELALQNPELFGENTKEPETDRSATSQLKAMLQEANGLVLKKIYEKNQDVVLFMNWAPKTMDHVDPKSETNIRLVISCYKLIKACQLEFPSLVDEVLLGMKCCAWESFKLVRQYQEQAKTVSAKNAPLFCLTRSYYRDGHLTPLRAGPRAALSNYLDLRRRENSEKFFNPGHPCYYARLAFNETIQIYRTLFDISKLQIMFESGDYEKGQRENIAVILNFVKTLDDNEKVNFLLRHNDTRIPGRESATVFCS